MNDYILYRKHTIQRKVFVGVLSIWVMAVISERRTSMQPVPFNQFKESNGAE
ncbi:hypothetical protein [Oceanobacillus piezotolerans]|uniref:hypothetical protein n=1 Tax=Oceanobacillus piezotolerans TaxID=2448030 RepID=UPI0013147F30|nr:hypothetical protein [Oceanobacillus piezotolerans]